MVILLQARIRSGQFKKLKFHKQVKEKKKQHTTNKHDMITYILMKIYYQFKEKLKFSCFINGYCPQQRITKWV